MTEYDRLVTGLERLRQQCFELRDRPREQRMVSRYAGAVQNVLAAEFGKARGWRYSLRDKWGPEFLARRGARAQPRDFSWPHHFDHPYGFRQNGRAVALAAHLYDHVDEALAWAPMTGLKATALPNVVSWWNPGGTTLVLYEPAI